MLKRRLIPVVLMRNGVAVQSKGFRRYQALGNPVTIVERLSDWCSDELIYLDITKSDRYDIGRDDLAGANRADPLEILEDIASRCFMPLTFGGRIRTIEDAATRIERGADKVCINSGAQTTPDLITQIADRFGSQCVVVNIDAKKTGSGWTSLCGAGHTRDAIAWALEAQRRGAGEILLQSVDQDGRGRGYDLELIRTLTTSVCVPVIALGGVGTWDHLSEGLGAGADAVAAANIFNYSEHAVLKAKRHLFESGANVRPPELAETMIEAA